MTEAVQATTEATQAEAPVVEQASAPTSLLSQPPKVPEPVVEAEATPETEQVSEKAAPEAESVPGAEVVTEEAAEPEVTEEEATPEAEEQVSEEEAKPEAAEAEQEEAAAPQLEWSDIRDFMAGDNEMLQKMLGRYRSAQALANAFSKQRQEISRLQKENQMAPELPDNPTEEEVEEYRKRLNIPNDVADYKIDFGEGFEATEADAPLLDGYKEAMHEGNVPPQYAQKTIEWYQNFAESQRQEMNQHAEETQSATVASLNNEWGKEYEGNLNAVRAMLNNTIGDEAANELRTARMADGSYLMDNANLLRLLAGPAVDSLGGVSMFAGDTAAGMKSLEAEKKEIMGLLLTDKNEYLAPGTQERLREINEKLEKLGRL